MALTGEWRETGAVAVVGGIGVATLLAHVYHLAVHDLPLLAVVFGVLLPMAVSATLIGAALWLGRSDRGDLTARVAAWSVAGAAVLVALAGANVVFQLAAGSTIEDVSMVILAQGSVGALLGVLLGFYDVQRIESRRRLVGERETATRLSRRLNVLNRVLRHDIRNKVTVIKGNADLVAAATRQTETAAETIRQQADEMVRLSEHARKLQAVLGDDEVVTEPVDVSTLVSAKAMRLRRDHEYATIHADVADDVWSEVSAFVDSAIENLLVNAVAHNDGTSPTVWIDVSTAEDDGGRVVVVRVADDGPGIPPDEVAVLQRGRETALEHASGLGLWFVHWIVTESGGSVDFEEREPRGSVVELTLPWTEPPEEGATVDSAVEPVEERGPAAGE